MNNLKAIKREKASSGSTNKLRQDGFIPAILYGGENPNQKISIEKKLLEKLSILIIFYPKCWSLKLMEKKKSFTKGCRLPCGFRRTYTYRFYESCIGKKNCFEIPVKFINHPDSPGLKRGGVFNIVRRAVELKCPAENIPG